MLERPSQHTVVGVANKYMKYQEAQRLLDTERFRMKNEDLDIAEAHRVGYAIGFGILRELIGAPLQARRRHILWEAQQAEGFVPGEENIARFALRICGSPERYPRVTNALTTESED